MHPILLEGLAKQRQSELERAPSKQRHDSQGDTVAPRPKGAPTEDVASDGIPAYPHWRMVARRPELPIDRATRSSLGAGSQHFCSVVPNKMSINESLQPIEIPHQQQRIATYGAQSCPPTKLDNTYPGFPNRPCSYAIPRAGKSRARRTYVTVPKGVGHATTQRRFLIGSNTSSAGKRASAKAPLVGATCVGSLGLAIGAAGAASAPPSVSTGAVSSVTPTSVVVAGVVDPHGTHTDWYFEYGPNTTFTAKTPVHSAGSGTAGVSVSEKISGLSVASGYDYRIVAYNSAGTVFGASGSFNTTSAPVVATGAAVAISCAFSNT